jgi:hypothetical protein
MSSVNFNVDTFGKLTQNETGTITIAYTISESDVTITDFTPKTYEGPLEIPRTLGGVTVKSIGYRAFYLCSNLTIVTFETGSELISIGDQSFRETIRLTSIKIPSSVTSIQTEAFNRSGLTTVTFDTGSQLTSIGTGAFARSGNLATVIFIGGSPLLQTIGNYAFQLTGLTSITIPDSVTSIGLGAFQGCSKLTAIEIPALVTFIGNDAFNSCTSLTLVTFASNSQFTSIAKGAFELCNKLTSIRIPNSVTSISDNAFLNCSVLNSITFAFDSPLQTIGRNAFRSCISLNSIFIPNSVISIDADTFTSSALTTMYVSTINSLGLIPGVTPVTLYGKTFTVVDVVANPAIPICFPAGTKVTTDQGDITIEKLNPKVNTIRGKKIVAITKSIPLQKHIISIEKDALAKNVPSVTTQISKEHKLFYKGKMIKARDLVEVCQGVTAIPYNGEILYNVLLKKHDKMLIHNLICETLHPENILAKIYNGNFQTTEKSKIYEKLNHIIRTNNVPEYNKLYASLK